MKMYDIEVRFSENNSCVVMLSTLELVQGKDGTLNDGRTGRGRRGTCVAPPAKSIEENKQRIIPFVKCQSTKMHQKTVVFKCQVVTEKAKGEETSPW